MIDGQKVRTGREIEVINPATGEVFATAARADEAVLDASVAVAQRTLPAWRGKKAQNAIAQTVATAAVRRRRLITQGDPNAHIGSAGRLPEPITTSDSPQPAAGVTPTHSR